MEYMGVDRHFREIVKELEGLSKWTGELIDFYGGSSDYGDLHISVKQKRSIIFHLQDKSGVIEIISAPNSLISEGLSTSRKSLTFRLRTLSSFHKFANDLHISKSANSSKHIGAPKFDNNLGILSFGDILITVKNPLEKIILQKLINSKNSTVKSSTIESNYRANIKNPSYHLKSSALKQKQYSINDKVRRKLDVKTNFISLKKEKMFLNPNFVRFYNN